MGATVRSPRPLRRACRCPQDRNFQSTTISLGHLEAIRLMKQVFKGYVKDVCSTEPMSSMHHHTLASHGAPSLLASAILVARMYMSKTPGTSAFIREMIESQYKKITAECRNYTGDEALVGVQAIILYMIMYMFDEESGEEFIPDETFPNLVLHQKSELLQYMHRNCPQ
ncbi:hypothetical protein VTO42DRAFT_2342 [Malbranchea cinnamomea]